MVSSQAVPQGYKQTKVGVIPEEWEEYLFDDIFVFTTGKNIKQDEASIKFNIPCVRYGELYHMYKEVITKVINKTNLDKSELLFSKGNEILLPSAGEDPLDIGSASALTLKDIAIGRTINILRPMKEDIYFQIYMAYYITNQLKRRIASLAKGSSISNVYNSDLKKIRVPLPPLKEQQKIAQILTTWDDAISKQEALIEEKEQLKKGLMQKLLSGEVRFEGFDGEWEEVRLGDVATFHKGKGISKNDISDDGIECIRYGELYTKYNERIEDVISKTSIGKENLFLSEVNDILIPASGETAIDLATASCVLKKDIGLGGDINIIRTNHDGIFLSYYLNIIAKMKIASLAQGVSVIHLYASQLKSLKIKHPPLQEQQKIAQTLSTADKEIELLKEELEVLKEQKRGLMQRLLTGEVRTLNIEER